MEKNLKKYRKAKDQRLKCPENSHQRRHIKGPGSLTTIPKRHSISRPGEAALPILQGLSKAILSPKVRQTFKESGKEINIPGFRHRSLRKKLGMGIYKASENNIELAEITSKPHLS
jgi:hypothetical protein